jgi:transposase
LDSSELPDNVILLFQPPACPEVNPTERVWEYLKYFLAWSVFSNLDELRTKVQEILASFTDRVIGFLPGWSWILHSLSLSHLYKNGIKLWDLTSAIALNTFTGYLIKLSQ